MESRIFDGVSARNRDEHRGNAMILLFHGVENRLALHPVPANRLEETGSRVIKSISRPVCYTASFCSLESIDTLLLFYFLHCRFSLTKNKTLEWEKTNLYVDSRRYVSKHYGKLLYLYRMCYIRHFEILLTP